MELKNYLNQVNLINKIKTENPDGKMSESMQELLSRIETEVRGFEYHVARNCVLHIQNEINIIKEETKYDAGIPSFQLNLQEELIENSKKVIDSYYNFLNNMYFRDEIVDYYRENLERIQARIDSLGEATFDENTKNWLLEGHKMDYQKASEELQIIDGKAYDLIEGLDNNKKALG